MGEWKPSFPELEVGTWEQSTGVQRLDSLLLL